MVIRYLTMADASKVLGLTPGGVRLMVRRKELELAAITEGGIQLFQRKDVEDAARKREKVRAAKEGRHIEDGEQAEEQTV
jgi:hypothetical protein